MDRSTRSHMPAPATPSARRVTHVMRTYGRPSETFVADTVANLEDLGWQASVVAAEVEHRDWFPRPPAERVHLARRPPAGRRLVGRLRPRAVVERTAAWYTPAVLRTRPTLLHAHFGWAGPLALPAAQRLGVPLAVTFHATDVIAWPYQDPRNLAACRRLFGHIDLAMAVSRFTESHLRAAGFTGEIAIEPAGVALDEFAFRPPRPHAGPTRLLFVGRLVPRKGLSVLLEALARLERRERVELQVIGDGPLQPESEALAASLGLGDRVRFAGAMPRAGVLAALADADVLVLPSRTMPDGEAEGSPTVLKEALAVGTPAVVTDNGGTREVVPPDLRDEIVPEGNAEALARRLDAVLDARPEWPARAHAGRRWVEQEFDALRLARRLAERYAALT